MIARRAAASLIVAKLEPDDLARLLDLMGVKYEGMRLALYHSDLIEAQDR